MAEQVGTTQPESRTEKVAIAVTPTEKRAVRGLAAIRGGDESNLVRSMTIAEIVAEFEKLQAVAQGTAA
jgi:hypothetical protein